jgi:hypothetical protein
MPRFRKYRKSEAGFSLIEAMVSTFIFLAALAAVYGSIASGRHMADVEETYAVMNMDARRALAKMSDELRMTGWRSNAATGEPDYPYVFTNGVAPGSWDDESHTPPTQHVPATSLAFGDVREIIFKIPVDQDGDGYFTSATTGEVEWSNYDVTYVLVTEANGINTLVRRQDGVVTDVLAEYVERITFDTIHTDPSIDMDEIVINIHMARPTPTGTWLESSLSTCVTMRNIADAG